MNKILIPLDGSALAENALEVADKMSGPDVTLVLLRVVNPVVGALSSDEEAEAQEYLDEVAAQLRRDSKPGDIRVLVVEGTTASTIIDTAEEEKVGLIIITTHGSGGLVRWLMGSVAERVVRHAPCPVLTIGRRTLEVSLEDE